MITLTRSKSPFLHANNSCKHWSLDETAKDTRHKTPAMQLHQRWRHEERCQSRRLLSEERRRSMQRCRRRPRCCLWPVRRALACRVMIENGESVCMRLFQAAGFGKCSSSDRDVAAAAATTAAAAAAAAMCYACGQSRSGLDRSQPPHLDEKNKAHDCREFTTKY